MDLDISLLEDKSIVPTNENTQDTKTELQSGNIKSPS